MGRKKTTTPSGKPLNDAVYCNILNCSNNSLTSIDPRTGKIVRFHSWPHPDKVGETLKDAAVKKAEKFELCRKWIVNSRRADLNVNNVKNKQACSIHFEKAAYNNPNDIHTSRLLPKAVPTLVECPNPPKLLTPGRPPPKLRLALSQPKKRLE
ncbi:hypothetical protein CAPTEDRAFT_228699 [Capitella teleta]|uniref:THAP-type domain-containing protein n=1 Tax=Capitella teleta TaxID=283909 RepID=R7TDT6_CAPTE|nr:hypothetical protein CAPTEDRAFT_228699 [Capitella teleta]|eukprot:ELT91908.1 hypothetical protein CAPTEDRAFT_228699 [Capitella teleta]